jgi:hypothetical protein
VLLSAGPWVDVVSPVEIRNEVVAIARDVVARHAHG